MSVCISAIGWQLMTDSALPKNGILKIQAMRNGSVVSLIVNDSLKVEFLDPCIPVHTGQTLSLSRSSRRSSGRSKTKGNSAIRRRGGGTRKKRQRAKTTPMTALLRILGFYLLVLLVDELVAPTIRTGSRESDVLTLQQFLSEDVLKYAPDIAAIELTGNVSAPELVQVLEHTGRLRPALQPMSLPTAGISRPSFIEAKFPEGSATAQLALAQVAMPFLFHSPVTYKKGEAIQNRFYRWWLDWEVTGNSKSGFSVGVTLDNTQYDGDPRYRAGINSSQVLTQLVVNTVEEQVKTMVQTGMIREHEYKGVADLLIGNFNPAPGFLPEIMKTSSGYHRDPVPYDNPLLREEYGAGRTSEDASYKSQFGARKLSELPNATMVRSRMFDQILSFTYEKDVLETEIAAYLEDEQGKTDFMVIDRVGKGKSHTYMIDQISGLQHKTRYNTISMDRRAILVNVSPRSSDTGHDDSTRLIGNRGDES